jgi:hypothetical protein
LAFNGHGVTSLKIEPFINIAVRTSNPAYLRTVMNILKYSWAPKFYFEDIKVSAIDDLESRV